MEEERARQIVEESYTLNCSIRKDGINLNVSVMNDDIAAALLEESRQITHTVTKEETACMVLENLNILQNHAKKYNQAVQASFEHLFKNDLQPKVNQECQYYSQLTTQMDNIDLFITKLKAVIEDTESKQSQLRKQKQNMQLEFENLQATLKDLTNKKELIGCNEKMKLLEDKEYCSMLYREKKYKSDSNGAFRTEVDTIKAHINLKEKGLHDFSKYNNELATELNMTDAQIVCLIENNLENLPEQFVLREAVLALENNKLRLETIKLKKTSQDKSIGEKQTAKESLSIRRKTLLELEEELESLRLCYTEASQRTSEIEELLGSLSELKEEINTRTAEKLKQEKDLYREATDLNDLENKFFTVHQQVSEEQALLDDLMKNTSDSKVHLMEQEQRFKNERDELTKCLAEHNMNYEEELERKNVVAKEYEVSKHESDEQFKLKMAEIDKMKNENDEIKQELEKSLQLVQTLNSLKEKLDKEKASLQDEYDTKYFNIFGVSSTLSKCVKSILKPPQTPVPSKRVTFDQVFSDQSSFASSVPFSQTNMSSDTPPQSNKPTITLQEIIRRHTENKKRNLRLASPETDK